MPVRGSCPVESAASLYPNLLRLVVWHWYMPDAVYLAISAPASNVIHIASTAPEFTRDRRLVHANLIRNLFLLKARFQ